MKIILSFWVAIVAIFPPATPLPDQDALTYTVNYVYDGDTMKVTPSEGGPEFKVRFLGIDCPEKGDLFSEQAKRLTDSLVHLGPVTLRKTGVDPYQRVIADVFVLSAGKNIHVNLALLERGLAWHYKRYDSRKEFAQAELDAKARKIGVWSQPDLLPPWEVRKQKRSGN